MLQPITAFLDGCWWCLGGCGASYGPRYPGKDTTPDQLARWREELARAADEYSLWVDFDWPNYRVGIPGFFSRYASGINTDWKIYYASDAPQLPVHSFDEVQSKSIGWFEPPPPLPADICILVRDIDNAYWDLFFRDDWAYDAVRFYLEERAEEFVNIVETKNRGGKKSRKRR